MKAEGNQEHEPADSPITYTLDEGLTAIGFGKFKISLLMYAGIGSFAEAIEMMLLSYIGLGIQPEWGLSSNEVNLVSALTFCGISAGSYLWGSVSDNHGRKNGFLSAATLVVIAGFVSTLAPNYTFFRMIFGIGLGGGHVLMSWFMEFHCTPNRSIRMVVFAGFAALGSFFEALLAPWIMTRYGWRWLVGASSVPHLVALLFSYYMPESPRFWCVQGDIKKATAILEYGAVMNKRNLPDGQLIYEAERTSSQYSVTGVNPNQTESGPTNEETTQAESRPTNEETTQAESRPTNVNASQRNPEADELNQGVQPVSAQMNENALEKTQLQLQSDELNKQTSEGGSSVAMDQVQTIPHCTHVKPDEAPMDQKRPLEDEQVFDSYEIKEHGNEEQSTKCPQEHGSQVSEHTLDDPPPPPTYDRQEPDQKRPLDKEDVSDSDELKVNAEDVSEPTPTHVVQEPKVTVNQKRPHYGEHVFVKIHEDASEDQSTKCDTSIVNLTLSRHTSEISNDIQPLATVIEDVVHQSHVTDDTQVTDPLLASTHKATPDVQRNKFAMLVSRQWIKTTVLLWMLYLFNVFS